MPRECGATQKRSRVKKLMVSRFTTAIADYQDTLRSEHPQTRKCRSCSPRFRGRIAYGLGRFARWSAEHANPLGMVDSSVLLILRRTFSAIWTLRARHDRCRKASQRTVRGYATRRVCITPRSAVGKNSAGSSTKPPHSVARADPRLPSHYQSFEASPRILRSRPHDLLVEPAFNRLQPTTDETKIPIRHIDRRQQR